MAWLMRSCANIPQEIRLERLELPSNLAPVYSKHPRRERPGATWEARARVRVEAAEAR